MLFDSAAVHTLDFSTLCGGLHAVDGFSLSVGKCGAQGKKDKECKDCVDCCRCVYCWASLVPCLCCVSLKRRNQSNTCTHTHTHAFIYTHMHIHTHTQSLTHTHTHTHTHTIKCCYINSIRGTLQWLTALLDTVFQWMVALNDHFDETVCITF